MISRIIVTVLLGAIFISSCAYETHTKQYRTEKIHVQYPEWDEATVQKVAARKVEIGMNPEMVVKALGEPDALSREGSEERWGSATAIAEGQDAYVRFVYFVYFKDGQVSRTTGDRNKLSWHLWRD